MFLKKVVPVAIIMLVTHNMNMTENTDLIYFSHMSTENEHITFLRRMSFPEKGQFIKGSFHIVPYNDVSQWQVA